MQRAANAAIADRPLSALTYAAPREPDVLLIDADFRVYRRAGSRLLYVKADCTAADRENSFFLHITPVDPADLPAARREYGFDSRVFTFATAAGGVVNGQCSAEYPLIDYPIAAIRTGQFNAAGEIWSGEYPFPQ